MRIMAAETGHAVLVHRALDEIIPLHPVLVRGAVREMRERRLAEFVLLELPVIFQVAAHLKTNRPVVILTGDRILQWLALRVALDARVAGANEIQLRRIDDVERGRLRDVAAAGSMTSLATNIPPGHGFTRDVVVH